ncbi:hypothetical protein PtB15_9B127 [Puccinia triticina]|nr:hypothetical protein PtB15_9B127 [Puccinia triticina]
MPNVAHKCRILILCGPLLPALFPRCTAGPSFRLAAPAGGGAWAHEAPLTSAEIDEVLAFRFDDLSNFLEPDAFPPLDHAADVGFPQDIFSGFPSPSSAAPCHHSAGLDHLSDKHIRITASGDRINLPPNKSNSMDRIEDVALQDSISDHESFPETHSSSSSGPKNTSLPLKRLHPQSTQNDMSPNQHNSRRKTTAWTSCSEQLSGTLFPPSSARSQSRIMQDLGENPPGSCLDSLPPADSPQSHALNQPSNGCSPVPDSRKSQQIPNAEDFPLLNRILRGSSIEEEDKDKNLFEISDLELKIFAWLNTVRLAPKKTLGKCAHPAQDKSTLKSSSILWKILGKETVDWKTLPSLIQMVIKHGNLSGNQVILETRELLEEVDLRNQQFLKLFTTPGDPKDLKAFYWEKHTSNEKLRAEEYLELHRWLDKKLHIKHLSTEYAQDGDPELLQGTMLESLSEFQEKLFGYFQEKGTNIASCIPGQNRWNFIYNKTKSRGPYTISVHEAMKTRTAMWILGEYYKGKNREAWEYVFGKNDENFLKVFALIKNNSFNNYPGSNWQVSHELEHLKILPWRRDLNQVSYNPFLDKHLIKSKLLKRLNKLNWALVDSQVDHYL